MPSQHLAQALDPQWTEAIREDQHRRDYFTLWFGIALSDGNSLSFEAHPRFGDLMRQHRQRYPQELAIYPRLVSFVGGTGAGKSTLIQMLIRRLWDPNAGNEGSETLIPVPIVGDNSSIPTSSDVHLYHDPIGDADAPGTPFLFADCEGFYGANHSFAAMVAKNMRTEIAKENEREVKGSWANSFLQATMRTQTASILVPIRQWSPTGCLRAAIPPPLV
jgi:hypothetical protein